MRDWCVCVPQIDERLGIRTELLNCVRASGMLVIPYYVIVIMQVSQTPCEKYCGPLPW